MKLVAIRDIEYLKELNATEEEIEITKQVLKIITLIAQILLRTILQIILNIPFM